MKTGRARRQVLPLVAEGGPGRFRASLPAGAAGQWCRLLVGRPGGRGWWVKLEAEDAVRGQVVREAFLGPWHRRGGLGWRTTLLHVPAAADSLSLQIFSDGPVVGGVPRAELQIMSRAEAALGLLRHGWHLLPLAVVGDARGLVGRARALLGQAPARAGEAPGYDVWTRLYDTWGEDERAALAISGDGGAHTTVIVIGADGSARDATLQSLTAQWVTPARIDTVARPGEWTGSDTEWVLVLQAGEVLAAHGLACFAHAARRWPDADGFHADLDVLTAGVRADPLFKPGADPWLLRSGLPTRGACLFRSTALTENSHESPDAESWRHTLALRLGAGRFRRVPFILTHVPGTSNGKPARARDGRLVVGRQVMPFVSIVVPSAARSRHMLRCLRRVVAQTDYAGGFEILLAVSNVDAADRIQSANLALAGRLPGVRVLSLDMSEFNYARVNNAAARQALGDVLLLLNDDVEPIRPDWLHRMVEYLCCDDGETADIVGARLLYGNRMVQHGGVIMGLGNLCEHGFRLSRRGDAGPHGVALLDRQVSAVTGACMLIRRALYDALGGMDESFAVALNDVDLCLRAGRRGARVVFAAGVELLHYESLSLGRHYSGTRAALEGFEVRRLRQRWQAAIADDPFYSRAASLEPGREFQPGFPMRLTVLSWISAEPIVPGFGLTKDDVALAPQSRYLTDG